MSTLRRAALAALTTVLSVVALVGAAAPAAHAGTNSWTGLAGLSSTSDGPWVREYVKPSPISTTIYAATEGDGVWKSTNMGLTWASAGGGLTGSAANVRTVYLDGNTVYAGTTTGLYKSTGGAFTPVAQGPGAGKLNKAVQAIYKTTGGGFLVGVASGGVYRSSDLQTWTPPAAGNGMPATETIWSLTSFAGNPAVIFAAAQSGIYRSTNGGATWTLASDGISDITLRVVADGTNPNIYYALTAGGGVYRTITAGASVPAITAAWNPINGTGSSALGNATTRAMVQFNGVGESRLYVGTADGLWVGHTSNGAVPGEVKWRHVPNTGLPSAGTIFWAMASFLTPPSVILAGTQGAGGYHFELTPPVNTVDPSITGAPQRGKTITANEGTWTGSPTIEFEYQWIECDAAGNNCADVEDAEEKTYDVPLDAVLTHRFKVKVTAKNDFPDIPAVDEYSETSPLTAAGVTANAGMVPSSDNTTISPVGPADGGLPQVGDTFTADPVTFTNMGIGTFTRKWQWYDCTDANFATCTQIPGATSQTLVLPAGTLGRRVCAETIGTNAAGTHTSECAEFSNTILAPDPVLVEAPKVLGAPTVGQSIVGTTGIWAGTGAWPGMSFARRWLRCDAAGADCSTISGQTASTLKLTAADLGSRIKLEVTHDSNGPNTFPAAVSVLSAPTTVVKNPPDTTKPVVAVSWQVNPIKQGQKARLKWTATEQVKLLVRFERQVAGHKVNGVCKVNKPGQPTTPKCFLFPLHGNVAMNTLQPKVGSRLLGPGVAGKPLLVGRYRVKVTPRDAAGNVGITKTIFLTIKPA